MHIQAIDKSLLQHPPLTQDELEAYEESEVDCVSITADSFRMDFSLPHTHPFNVEAIEVFAEHFIECVAQDGWYRDAAIPPDFLEPTIVMGALQKHLKYVFQVYRELNAPECEAKTQKSIQRRTRATRTTRKGWVRIFIFINFYRSAKFNFLHSSTTRGFQ